MQLCIPPDPKSIRKSDGIFLKLVISSLENLPINAKDSPYQITLTLFDLERKQSFGSSWKSGLLNPSKCTNLKCSIPLYLYTFISNALLIVEVAVRVSDKFSDYISCGWGTISEFSGTQRIQMYYGSPRVLYILGKSFLAKPPTNLSRIEQFFFTCSFQTHTILKELTSILPENCIVSGKTKLPGLKGVGDDKLSIPKIEPRCTLYVKNLSINFSSPSLDVFEADICEYVCKDLIVSLQVSVERSYLDSILDRYFDMDSDTEPYSWKSIKPMAKIADRKLRVVVHNGYDTMQDDHIIFLHSKTSSKKQQLSSASSQQLYAKNFEINDIAKDEDLSIIFCVEYHIEFPEEIRIICNKKLGNSTKSFSSLVTKSVLITKWNPFSGKFRENTELRFNNSDRLISEYRNFVYAPKPKTTDIFAKFKSSKSRFEYATGEELGNDEADYFIDEDYESSEGLPVNDNYSVDDDVVNLPKIVTNSSSVLQEADISQVSDVPFISPRSPSKSSKKQRREDTFIHSTPRNVETPRSNFLKVSDPETCLKEIPYNQAPGSLLLTTGLLNRKPTPMPRVAYAQIFSSNFPIIKDDFGKLPVNNNVGDTVVFNINKEMNDPATCNEVFIQFLAMSKHLELLVDNVFFTFQFYNYPQITTARVKLIGKEYSGKLSDIRPFIFQKLNNDDSLSNEQPGLLLKYFMDPAFFRTGESSNFFNYLANNFLTIDVFDGDSLMHLGSAQVELKHLLRQRRAAVQITHEVEILRTDLSDDSSALTGDLNRSGRIRNAMETTSVGRLHIRLTNVGHTSSSHANLKSSSKHSIVNPGDRNLHDDNGDFFQQQTFQTLQGFKLTDTNKDLQHLLTNELESTNKYMTSSEKKRKLQRMKFVRENVILKSEELSSKMANENAVTAQKIDLLQRKKEIKIIDSYRESKKRETIQTMLLSSITTNHSLNPSFGKVEFFEFQFTNPYAYDDFFFISCDDDDVKIVVDKNEWSALKHLNRIPTPIYDVFVAQTKGIPEIYLKQHETVHIPIKCQVFSTDYQYTSPDGDQFTRQCRVVIRDKEENPLSIIQVDIKTQPPICNQTFRLHCAENTIMRKTVRLPPYSLANENGNMSLHLSAKSSDMNTLCSVSEVRSALQPRDISIKTTTGQSPSIKRFYISIFRDKYEHIPIQIWEFYLHSLKRVDFQCTAGQTSQFSLLVRSDCSSRVVKAYPSHPSEMHVVPKEAFILSPGSPVELDLALRPLRPKSQQMLLNIVDTDLYQMVQAYLINVICALPLVSKAFELKIPIGEGAGQSTVKKVKYKNRYTATKKFNVFTNRADLLVIKESEFSLGPGEEKSIALQVLPLSSPGKTEVLLYINDENGNNEECFCIKLSYLSRKD